MTMAEAETAKKLMGTAGPYGNGLTKTETAAAATNSRDSRDTKEALKVRSRTGANTKLPGCCCVYLNYYLRHR